MKREPAGVFGQRRGGPVDRHIAGHFQQEFALPDVEAVLEISHVADQQSQLGRRKPHGVVDPHATGAGRTPRLVTIRPAGALLFRQGLERGKGRLLFRGEHPQPRLPVRRRQLPDLIQNGAQVAHQIVSNHPIPFDGLRYRSIAAAFTDAQGQRGVEKLRDEIGRRRLHRGRTAPQAPARRQNVRTVTTGCDRTQWRQFRGEINRHPLHRRRGPGHGSLKTKVRRHRQARTLLRPQPAPRPCPQAPSY